MVVAGTAKLDLVNAPTSLAELMQRQVEFARMVFPMQGEIHPMWVGQSADGILYPLTATFDGDDDKDRTVAEVKEIFAKHNVVRYVFMAESWMVTAHKDKEAELRASRPSQHPDRKEVIFLAGSEHGSPDLMGFITIERDAEGKGTLTDHKIETAGKQSEGRFVDVLPPPPNESKTVH